MTLLDRVAFGSSYYPPHHSPEDWVRDLDRMAESGLWVIRSAELLASWDRIEVARHEYDFGWLDRLFDLAGERGIKILLGTGSCCPPVWMASEYDDIHVVSRDGVPYPNGAMWSWACKDHPGYQAEVERWIRVLAGRYGDRPELLGWQIDNEPGYPFIPRKGREMDN
jgi:beta-galactosidase